MCRRKKRRHCVVRPHRKNHTERLNRAFALVNNTARVGTMSGLIPVNVQIPINLGNANAFNNSHGSSAINIL